MQTQEIPVFLVDDEPSLLFSLENYFTDYCITSFSQPGEALAALQSGTQCSVAIVDYKMPGMNGLELLMQLKQINPGLVAVLLTAHANKEMLEKFINQRLLFRVLEKPVDFDVLEQVLQEALSTAAASFQQGRRLEILEARLQDLEQEMDYRIIGTEGGLADIMRTIQACAAAESPVLIYGETGTGKESIARLLHNLGKRRGKPFVAINCSAYSENLIESELFGHEKGAFTGADRRKLGKFELADGGTLFLDEVGDIPLTVQTKLLRVLQEKTIERVGGTTAIAVDFALVTATNKDLQQCIADKSFREDLFYRVCVQQISLPPLRKRKQDIRPMLSYYLEKLAAKQGLPVPELEPGAWNVLQDHDWPGNIRELRNTAERILITWNTGGATGTIAARDIVLVSASSPPVADYGALLDGLARHISSGERDFDVVKADLIREILACFGGDVLKAAAATGISKNTFYRYQKTGDPSG